jgi:hypothetical protein
MLLPLNVQQTFQSPQADKQPKADYGHRPMNYKVDYGAPDELRRRLQRSINHKY